MSNANKTTKRNAVNWTSGTSLAYLKKANSYLVCFCSPPCLVPSHSIYNKPVNKMWEWTAVESAVPVHAKAMLPSSSAITIQLGAGVSMITFVNTVPINDNKCVNR